MAKTAAECRPRGVPCYVSFEAWLGCGVGACLTCVVKFRPPDGDWRWVRACKEGPVFECRQLEWEEEA